MEWGGYYLRGWAHEMLGSNRQAIQDYSTVINLKAESDINYYRRGRCYERLGEYQEAVESYTQIINMKQNNSPKNQVGAALLLRCLGTFQIPVDSFEATSGDARSLSEN
jgi:tetratricopeptide (TPR) repeat protein